ncbi:MAG: M1 family metallopeptidase [Saprospiraceae bacterium]|nr:M1 family metallopeptidase [Saprospiraceae bacterium]
MRRCRFLSPIVFLFAQLTSLSAQVPAGYWQQRVEYQIDIRLDDQTHAVQGREKLKYFNNSPDTLRRVFFHLYWNAFQPNSANAQWAKRLQDAETSRQYTEMKPEEMGKQDIFLVHQNGNAVSYKVNETIMEVTLNRPLSPNDYTVFDIAWQGQVPIVVGRGGRDNSSGVAYSFTQWYPKICVYDRHGWHADPHVGQEFYGEYGSFKVNITLPKKYLVAATGVLQNANIIGFGYEDEGAKPAPNYGLVNVWKFEADHVHDFAWSADPEYVHEKVKARDGLMLHFIYQPSPAVAQAYKALKKFAVEQLPYIEANFGKYLYPQFTFAEGGQWAMEYPMLTLIEHNGSDTDVTPTALHEWMHNWYYGMMGNNENAEPWLDEGFTSYATSDILGNAEPKKAAQTRRSALKQVAQMGNKITDPVATHAYSYQNFDWYGFNAYPKGEAFLWQLRYIVGDETFRNGMLRYHADWHFKHPSGTDFMRTMERASGMELDWYYAGWIKAVRTIDYGVETPVADGPSSCKLILKNHGSLPMPVEVLVTYRDGNSERHYVPLDLQYGTKNFPENSGVIKHPPWSFSVDTYEIRLEKPATSIKSVSIDPDEWTADTNRANNRKDF